MIKSLFCRILLFFNLVDRKRNLSITNIGVYVLLVKIGMAKTLDWPTASALLITMLSYSHKRYETNKSIEKEVGSISTAMETIDSVRKKLEGK